MLSAFFLHSIRRFYGVGMDVSEYKYGGPHNRMYPLHACALRETIWEICHFRIYHHDMAVNVPPLWCRLCIRALKVEKSPMDDSKNHPLNKNAAITLNPNMTKYDRS